MDYWSEDELTLWLDALTRGDVVAAPAEGVYGYCCDPFNEQALQKLCAIKSRTDKKGFIVLVRTFSEARALAGVLSGVELETMENCWPGATTLVLPAAENLPPLLTGGRRTIAIRMPSSDYMQEYLAAWGGPLVSTSLNLSGQTPVTNSRLLPPDVAHLTLPKVLSGKASKIFDAENGKWLR